MHKDCFCIISWLSIIFGRDDTGNSILLTLDSVSSQSYSGFKFVISFPSAGKTGKHFHAQHDFISVLTSPNPISEDIVLMINYWLICLPLSHVQRGRFVCVNPIWSYIRGWELIDIRELVSINPLWSIQAIRRCRGVSQVSQFYLSCRLWEAVIYLFIFTKVVLEPEEGSTTPRNFRCGGRLCYIYDSSKNHNTAVPCQRFPLTQKFIGFPHSSPILSPSRFRCSLTPGPVAALHSFWKLTEKREKQNTEAFGLCSLGRPAIKWEKKKPRQPVSSFPQQHASPRVVC